MSNLDISVISADAVPAAQRSKNEAPGASPDHYPQVLRWTRASGTTGGKGEVPSLAKEGTPRHQVNGPVPLEARPGWFVQLPIIGGLNQPPPSAPGKEASRHFLNGRSHPSLSKEGTSAFPSVVFNAPCPAAGFLSNSGFRHHLFDLGTHGNAVGFIHLLDVAHQLELRRRLCRLSHPLINRPKSDQEFRHGNPLYCPPVVLDCRLELVPG